MNKTENNSSSLKSNAKIRVYQGKMMRETKKQSELKQWHKVLYIIYFVVFFLALTFLLLKLWSLPVIYEGESTSAESEEWHLWRLSLKITEEVRLILIVAVMGALGSCVYEVKSFVYYVGKGQFETSYMCWYILRPIIGSTLAIIFYFAFRGAFFSFSANTQNLNEFGIATLGGVVGIFSYKTMNKLEELFDNILLTRKEEKNSRRK